jgi:hypothetical protein
MPNPTLSSRLFLSIAIAAFFATCMTCAFIEGRITERARQGREQDAMIAACREDNVILQRRYDSLAQESDAITVIAAEAAYQRGGR